MECVTPSNPTPIPPGFILDIEQTLEKTNGGSLYRDGRPMEQPMSATDRLLAASTMSVDNKSLPPLSTLDPSPLSLSTQLASPISVPSRPRPYRAPQDWRSGSANERWKRFFLQAQSIKDEGEIEELWKKMDRPPDPIRTMYKDRQMRRMGRKFSEGWVRGQGRPDAAEAADAW